jgi:tetratricopeptide (TPR) repeat protein
MMKLMKPAITGIIGLTEVFAFAALLILTVNPVQAQTRSRNAASQIFESCHSSVVIVVPLDKDNKPLGQGSGFIIETNKVVTNHHVLADSPNAAVIFADGATEFVDGFLTDSPTRDITIVSVKTGNRASLKTGDELSLKQGDNVYAIGAPRGLDLSITNGIVSGFRTIGEQFLLQTTAAIAPGSSGGPLFDENRSVVGVTTSLLTDSPGIYSSVGIGDVARIMRSASTIVLPLSSLAPSTNTKSTMERRPEVDSIGKLIAEKDYVTARNRLKPLLEESPRDPTLNRLLGEVDLYQGQVSSAVAHLKVAVEGNPSDMNSNFFYAIGLFFAAEYDDSGHYQELVVEADPSAANIGILSEIYYGQQNYAKAEAQALKALGSDPSEDTALEVIAGNLYWRRSQSGLSWKDVQERLIKAKSDSYWVKVGNALDLMQHKKDDDAVSVLTNAKKDSFPDPAANLILSYLYIQHGQVELARSEAEDALGNYPYNERLLNQGMFIALIGHDETAAGRYYSRLAEITKGGPELLPAACLYFYGVGKSVEAVDSCSKAVNANAKNHTAHSNLGWAALDADQFKLALGEFSSAYGLVKDDWKNLTQRESIDLIWGFAIASYFNGDKKTCKKLLEDIKSSDPSMLTITGLEQLPLVWSRKTTSRIEQILRDVRP